MEQNEKKMSEKKQKEKIEAETGMGYCPFSVCVGSRYNRLYRDTARLGKHQGSVVGAHGWPQYGRLSCDTARGPATRPAVRRAAWLVGGGLTAGCVARQTTTRPCDTAGHAPRYGREARDTTEEATTRRAAEHATTRRVA